MATTPDNNLRFDVPDVTLDDNTWGTILNTLISELERSITANVSSNFTSSDITLVADGTVNDVARRPVLIATGTLAGNVNYVVPNEPKIYIVRNATSGAFTLGIKTSAGTRLDIPQGDTILVFCDGVGNGAFFQINALVSGTVAKATDADTLITIAGANFGQKAVKNQWTKPQVLLANRAVLTLGNPKTFTPDVDSETNILVTQAEMDRDANDLSIVNPTGTPEDGQIMVVTVEQGASVLKKIIWGTKFKWPDDTAIELTQTVNKIDAFSFMYNSNVSFWLNFGTALNIPRA